MSTQTKSAPRTRARFFILGLLTIGTMINYLDRTVLGIAAPLLREDLAISAATMGIVFSAFSWTYAAMQIPGGIFLDRFGTKLTYFLSLTFWSIATLLHGIATNLASLLTFRFALGVSEAPCFPTNSRVVATWFPQQERAFATGVYTVGEYVGLAFLSPLLFWILGAFGWRALFFVVGVAGVLFGLVWWKTYREPHESQTVNQAELDYIAAGGGIVTQSTVKAKRGFHALDRRTVTTTPARPKLSNASDQHARRTPCSSLIANIGTSLKETVTIIMIKKPSPPR